MAMLLDEVRGRSPDGDDEVGRLVRVERLKIIDERAL